MLDLDGGFVGDIPPLSRSIGRDVQRVGVMAINTDGFQIFIREIAATSQR
jgi:hypothetical protein